MQRKGDDLGAAMSASKTRLKAVDGSRDPRRTIAELTKAVQKNVCVALPLEQLDELDELLHRVNQAAKVDGLRYTKRELYIAAVRHLMSLSPGEVADLLAT